MKFKGIICGILAAVCYGTNPLGALPLYEEGVNTSSVLFYRFSLAVVILCALPYPLLEWLEVRHRPFILSIASSTSSNMNCDR
jgi:drug/metabolite transporter (DMT)-like permease